MILFFRSKADKVYAVGATQPFQHADIQKFVWLFGGAELVSGESLTGIFIGPRKEMVTPWSTNAVEITQTMGLSGIYRIEEFFVAPDLNARYDKMLQVLYTVLDQDIFTIHHSPEA